MQGRIQIIDGRHRLRLSAEQLRAFAESLGELASSPYGEVRVEAVSERPGEQSGAPDWVIYWKLKEGETKLLLAHPELGQWVGTCAFSAAVASAFTRRILALAPATRLDLRDPELLAIAPVTRTSNFDLEIECVA